MSLYLCVGPCWPHLVSEDDDKTHSCVTLVGTIIHKLQRVDVEDEALKLEA